MKHLEYEIFKAAEIIKQGGIVSFPTETVYGLGADAFNSVAVEKIFELKQRPTFDPLIVHLYSIEQLPLVTDSKDERVIQLANNFWPGPLTLVLKKKKNLPDIVTSGLETVAIRIPDNQIALELIKHSNTVIAAPSANKFGRTSPTKAEHVKKYFPNIDYVIDGGGTTVGIESTIIFLNQFGFEILRPGIITKEEIEKYIPYYPTISSSQNFLSPGMTKSHYSPLKPFYLLTESVLDKIDFNKAGLISYSGKYDKKFKKVVRLSNNKNLRECAINLFSAIHLLEESDVDIIVAETVPETGIGFAIMDRLKKAAYNYMKNI